MKEPGQLPDVPVLELTTEHWQSMDWDTWLLNAGFGKLRLTPHHYFNDFVMLQSATERGHGVALGWAHLVSEAIEDGRLVRPFKATVQTPGGWGYYAYPADRRSANPAAVALLQWLGQQVMEA